DYYCQVYDSSADLLF
nr:immunoglobulin light chain junction region [Macaca mulatta]MOX78176.1 immunoglobulin light chain junction region [Macaca mulatta]MOX83616.1 immunoglobulin light chain junction region [Macaca mulatta]MOX84280.1 immunoglobulin light chain junction region [Macaca mulatta]MOX84318.1 immunoglobulin light chain junction region [Macaca mulatta]